VKDSKQVIVIRRDLGMRRGKEIAQGSHASMAWLTRQLQDRTRNMMRLDAEGGESPFCGPASEDGPVLASVVLSEAQRHWIEHSFAKVVCQVPDEDTLTRVAGAAREAGLECHVITDSGRTEFHGEPTVTALAIGPDWAEKIDQVTSNLELY
jgi:peptidyl-tRNA hydrolase, PTH2 family